MTFWTAGFDIIYSCQDYEFDQREGLFSLPRDAGIAGALWVARALHLGMVVCLLALVPYAATWEGSALAGVGGGGRRCCCTNTAW